MKNDTLAFKQPMENFYKAPGALWDTLNNFGEIGEYRVPENAKISYFRTKVLELLVCLSVMDARDAKDGGTYFYKDKVEKTRAVQKLISENMAQDYTIEGLAAQFNISQTALKGCFCAA